MFLPVGSIRKNVFLISVCWAVREKCVLRTLQTDAIEIDNTAVKHIYKNVLDLALSNFWAPPRRVQFLPQPGLPQVG